MYNKGRDITYRGEDVVGSKLTNKQAEEIRESDLTGRELAEKYGVSHTTIYAIKNGERYAII
jgi:predicted DNA-binding protein YlxM (UPF0122 family)